MSPFSWSLWVQKNLVEIYLVLLPFTKPPLICKIQATLSLYNLVTLYLIKDSPHDSCVCWIINFSHTHSRLASWIQSISKWFEIIDYHCLLDWFTWYCCTSISIYIYIYISFEIKFYKGLKDSQHPYIQTIQICTCQIK